MNARRQSASGDEHTLEGSGFSPLMLRDAMTLMGIRWTSSTGGFWEDGDDDGGCGEIGCIPG